MIISAGGSTSNRIPEKRAKKNVAQLYHCDTLLAYFIHKNLVLYILLRDFTIVASEGYMRAIQMSKREYKNFSELFKTNGMRLDVAGALVNIFTCLF